MAKEIGSGAGSAGARTPEAGSEARDGRVAVAALLTGALVWGLVWYPYRVLRDLGIDGLAATSLTYLVALVVALLVCHVNATGFGCSRFGIGPCGEPWSVLG